MFARRFLISAITLFTLGSPLGAVMGQAPDRRADTDYLDRQIKHISDADLFAALDLQRPGLKAVKAAVEAKDYPAAYRAWAAYWDSKNKVTLVGHGRELKPMVELAKELRARPARVIQARRDAEPLMRHNIRGWGDVTHQHGPVVDFNFDYGRSGKYGFHYWGWSAPLLTAFHATGEAKYLAEFDRLFNGWYEQRDAVQGAIRNLDVIWYELGLGLRNRKFLHYYTCPWADRPLETHKRMLKTALGAARWLYELQRRGYRGGNWQIMGSYGLADIAVRLPEFRESPQWLEVGIQRLADHIQRDFFEDGCHSERAPSSYMVICYSDPHNLIALLKAAGIENESVRRFGTRLEKVLQWWMLATNPLGGLPALNDGSSRKLPAALLEGATLYDRSDFLYVADLARGAAQPAGKPPEMTSVHLEPSGVTVMRSGWRRRDNYLFLNYGTHNAGHTHRATLDFELFGCGGPLALDAGIGHSYDDPLHHRWYTTARAHNMLVVDEANVDKRAARGRDVLWHSDPRVDVFAATHEGYKKSHGLTHRRAVAFLKPDVFVVFDSCVAERDGQTLSWYFHSPTKLKVGEAGRVASTAGPGVLLVEAWPDQLSSVRRGQGMCALGQFGNRRQIDIDWIAYDKPTRVGNDNRFAVLMLPFSDTPPDVTFTTSPSPPGTAALHLRRGAITDFLVFGNGKQLALLDGRLVTDGVFAWVHEDGKGQRRGTVVEGKTLNWDGQALQPLLRSPDSTIRE